MSNHRKLTRNILIALALGVIVGTFLPEASPWVSWLGRIFKLSLGMIVMPIILTSVIDGMGSIGDVGRLEKLGIKTLIYFLATTFIAIVIGLFLVSTIKPGVRDAPIELSRAIKQVEPATTEEAARIYTDLAAQHFGEKLSESARQDFEKSLSQYAAKHSDPDEFREATLHLLGSLPLRAALKADQQPNQVIQVSPSEFLLTQIDKSLVNPFEALGTKNVLAVIVFALLFGGALTRIGAPGQKVLEINRAAGLAITKIVDLVMYFAPLGVFGLLVEVLATTGIEVFRELGWYALCVVIGLAFHLFVVLPILMFVITRKSPLEFFAQTRPALMVAFSTSSSNATLPVTMSVVEEDLKVDRRISRFVLPLGATINMNGTALYEAVAAVFIAQLYGVALGFSSQMIIALTAALAAIGAAGIPAAGTVTMALVLSAVGLPLEGIGLLLAIDRPLDMCRTAVNVMGDAVGCVILQKVAKNDLASA